MLYKFANKKPTVADNVFIADGSRVIGDVKIEESSSVWYNAVIRGDENQILIGKYSNVQDNSTFHVDHKHDLKIGDYVTIGHNAVIHGCEVKNNCIIGMGAVLLNGCTIGENCIIGAGALVPENKDIPAGSLVVGMPGKVIRNLNEKEVISLKEHALSYHKLALNHLDN